MNVMVLQCFADTYGIMTGNIDKVWYSGIVAGETQYQNQAIAYLCSQYLKANYPNFKEKVFLELGFADDKATTVAYDKFQGDMWNNAEKNRPAKGFGLRITFSSRINRAQQVLKLLDYGVNHFIELKKQSKRFYATDYYDRPDNLTIDSLQIQSLLASNVSQPIQNILNIKVYRNLGEIGYDFYKEYYFQNDQFHFIDYSNKDSVYLKLDRVYQLVSDYNIGTIIFDTDSTLYFYNSDKRKLSEVQLIKDKQESFYYKKTGADAVTGRIYFEYQPYRQQSKKFIMNADPILLLQGFEEFENEIIEQKIKSTKG